MKIFMSVLINTFFAALFFGGIAAVIFGSIFALEYMTNLSRKKQDLILVTATVVMLVIFGLALTFGENLVYDFF